MVSLLKSPFKSNEYAVVLYQCGVEKNKVSGNLQINWYNPTEDGTGGSTKRMQVSMYPFFNEDLWLTYGKSGLKLITYKGKFPIVGKGDS